MKQGSLSFSLSLLGAFLGLSIGYLIFVQGKKLPLKTFFNVSSILLIFVASGMMAYGVHELESAGIIPNYGRLWDINPEIFSGPIDNIFFSNSSTHLLSYSFSVSCSFFFL